ncbi:MAG: hypothetical protein IJ685_12255 [Selenomonadaceae bacterium]|nr:hypothetical protein [Selenomonadaceae bacterium]
MSQILHGDTKGNWLIATDDSAQLYGLAGNDTLTSANCEDVLLIGGSGDDYLQLSGGNGTLSGGNGADIFAIYYSATNSVSAVLEDIDPTSDKIIITGETSPKLTSTASETDLIIVSDDGNLSVTLKGVQEQKNYFDGTAPEEVWDVFRLTNAQREDENLSLLTLNQDLTNGASIRVAEIEETFGHTRPDGTSCFTVLNESYTSTGENIAAGQNSASSVVTAWMNSTGHRENILSGSFTKLGVGYAQDSLKQYGYYWVQMFGGTANDTISLTQNQLSTVPIVSVQGTTLNSTKDNVDDTDPANWPSDWIVNPNFYTGGWQTISNVVSGSKIYFGTEFTGANFDGAGNLLVSSNVGMLTVQNVRDKVIDVSNAAGKTFLTAYEAFWPGTLDGRGLSGYELIQGSNFGSDIIFAGEGGSNLWGGTGTFADTLVGGNGADLFTGGKYQGSDSIINASSGDIVNLSDANLSDIVATASDGNTVGILFNTGNVITVQGNDVLSAAIVLNDSTWRFNQTTQTWQSA